MKPQAASPETSAHTREEEQAEVIRRLEEDIIFGRFAPGSRLVEDTLMTRYGASRHFVRQALFQLERQGIVLREKNIGATVRFYSSEEVRQIYEVREMLTRQAALMIALPALRLCRVAASARVTPAWTNSSFILAIEPRSALICFSRLPGSLSPPPFGFIHCQK